MTANKEQLYLDAVAQLTAAIEQAKQARAIAGDMSMTLDCVEQFIKDYPTLPTGHKIEGADDGYLEAGMFNLSDLAEKALRKMRWPYTDSPLLKLATSALAVLDFFYPLADVRLRGNGQLLFNEHGDDFIEDEEPDWYEQQVTGRVSNALDRQYGR